MTTDTATTTIPPEPPPYEEPQHVRTDVRTEGRFRRAMRKARNKTANGFRRVGHGIKALFTGVVRGAAYVGTAATWLVKTVAIAAVALVAAVAGIVVGLVSMVVGVAIWGATTVIRMWNIYVVGFFLFFTETRYMTMRTYYKQRGEGLTDRVGRWFGGWTETVSNWMHLFEEDIEPTEPTVEHIDLDGDTLVTQERIEETDEDYLVKHHEKRFREQREAEVAKKMAEAAQADREATHDQAFPGAGVWEGEEGPDQFDVITPRTTLTSAITDWKLETGKPELEFDFTPYLEEPDLRERFEFFMYDTPVKQESTYWLGRIEAWDKYKQSPDRLSLHGQWWALTSSKYRNRQAEYPQPALRAGFMDMIKELTKAKSKVGA